MQAELEKSPKQVSSPSKRVKLENKTEEKMIQVLLGLLKNEKDYDREMMEESFIEIYNDRRTTITTVNDAKVSYSDLEKSIRQHSKVAYFRDTEHWTLPLHSNQSLGGLLMNALEKEYKYFRMFELLPKVKSEDSPAEKAFVYSSIQDLASRICGARFAIFKLVWEANVIGEEAKLQFPLPKSLNVTELISVMRAEKGATEADCFYPCSGIDFF